MEFLEADTCLTCASNKYFYENQKNKCLDGPDSTSIGNYILKNSNKRVLYISCDNFVSDFVEMCRKNNGTNNMEAIKQFKN